MRHSKPPRASSSDAQRARGRKLALLVAGGALGVAAFYACSSDQSSTQGVTGGPDGGAGSGVSGKGGAGGAGGTAAGAGGAGGSGAKPADSGTDRAGGGGTGGSGGSGGTAGAGGGSGAMSMDGAAGSAAGADAGGTDGSVAEGGDAGPTACSGTNTSVLFNAPAMATGAWPPPSLKLTKIGSTFSDPVFLTSAPGDTARVFVVEQTGKIQIVTTNNGQELASAFLDVSNDISVGDERGLLGLAFHPGYAQNGRFFIYYTAATHGDPTIVEYARSAGDPNVANPTPTKTLFHVVHQNCGQAEQGNHNGGMLAFGKDGFLYAGTGDGGCGGDPDNNSQTLSIELGKILRFDVDDPTCSPSGNLQGRVWDYGMRNPWRWSFDRLNGDMYIGDVGQDTYEEVDVEPAGQGGKNYGWHVMEGTHCYNASTCDMTNKVLPILDYQHNGNLNCVIGGYVYRGSAIPGLYGTYLYADHGSSQVWALQWSGGSVKHMSMEITSDLTPGATLSGIGAFGQDANGELYIVSHDNGLVYRIDAQ